MFISALKVLLCCLLRLQTKVTACIEIFSKNSQEKKIKNTGQNKTVSDYNQHNKVGGQRFQRDQHEKYSQIFLSVQAMKCKFFPLYENVFRTHDNVGVK